MYINVNTSTTSNRRNLLDSARAVICFVDVGIACHEKPKSQLSSGSVWNIQDDSSSTFKCLPIFLPFVTNLFKFLFMEFVSIPQDHFLKYLDIFTILELSCKKSFFFENVDSFKSIFFKRVRYLRKIIIQLQRFYMKYKINIIFSLLLL